MKDGRIVIWYGGGAPGVLATKRSLDFAKALFSLTHIRGFYGQQQEFKCNVYMTNISIYLFTCICNMNVFLNVYII